MSVAEARPHIGFSLRHLFHARRHAWPLTVSRTAMLAPRMMRVHFSGGDLGSLVWKRGQHVLLEIPQSDGGIARRHYTIRDHDAAARTMAIDFVLHGDSATGNWLRRIVPGERVTARGPRGHVVVNEDADWHLFLGDETGMPGAMAMLEGLPANAVAFAFLEIGCEDDKLAFPARSGVTLEWISRGGAPAGPNRILLDRLERFDLPAGRGHAYITGETSNVRTQRRHLLGRGLAKGQIAAEGFWRPGRVGGHDHV